MIGNGAQPQIEIPIWKRIHVTGSGDIVANVLQITGSVNIVSQYAALKEVTDITNATNVHATLYDGTNTKDLTADGATLSGAPVGTLFLKDRETTDPYTVLMSDECRVNEVLQTNRIGKPFEITQKNGADTFIQLRLKTSGSVDFVVDVFFRFQKLGLDSNLVFL